MESDDISPAHAAQDLILRIRRRRLEERRTQLRACIDAAPDEKTKERFQEESSQIALDLSSLRRGWQQALPLLDLDAR